MADMRIKRMNWYQKRPLYKEVEAWREKRRAGIAEYQEASAAAASGFAAAQTSYSTGMATLAGKASLARIQNEIKAVASDLPVDKLV